MRNEFETLARQLMGTQKSHARREPGWAYRHGLRTANLSLWLREQALPGRVELDDLLYVAALFHDCAKTSKSDHGAAGAEKVKRVLKGMLDKEQLKTVCHAIFVHNKRGQPCSDLEKIVQDADIIDHFGSIEVWLNVSYSVLGGEGPERSLQFYAEEWEGMVAELRKLFNYEAARRVFEERAAYSQQFCDRLAVESAGSVYR